jgi:hypothetical protein
MKILTIKILDDKNSWGVTPGPVMTTTTTRPTVHPSVSERERTRPWWLWIVTALAFPPAGFMPVPKVSPTYQSQRDHYEPGQHRQRHAVHGKQRSAGHGAEGRFQPSSWCFPPIVGERMRGIEPPYSAWEADVLPLNYIRGGGSG